MLAGRDGKSAQCHIKPVLRIGTVKAVVAVAPAGDQTSRFQFRQLVLNGLKREIAQAGEFPHIQLCPSVGEKQPHDFRAHARK